jgi:hypothetical protein
MSAGCFWNENPSPSDETIDAAMSVVMYLSLRHVFSESNLPSGASESLSYCLTKLFSVKNGSTRICGRF